MRAYLPMNERTVAEYLRKSPLDETAVEVYTLMLCRQYRDTEAGLVNVLAYFFPTVADVEQEIRRALQALIGERLLTTAKGKEKEYIEAGAPWQEVLRNTFPGIDADAEYADIASIVDGCIDSFSLLSRHERKLIERVGWASSDKARNEFCARIRDAQHNIRLGVYSSKTLFAEIRDTIYNAWLNHQSLSVQLLMLSPKLAVKTENNINLGNDVKHQTENWKALFHQACTAVAMTGKQPRLEIRWLQCEDLVAFHRVMLVDNRDWILNIHRPGIERGIEGIVYQGRGEGRTSNLYDFLDYYWCSAWDRGIAVFPDERKPRVFIASASESEEVVNEIKRQLEESGTADVIPWFQQGVFESGDFILDALLDRSKCYDFAVIVYEGIDRSTSRGVFKMSARDNVVFELGMFLERLGKRRTIVVVNKTADLKMPEDISGWLTTTYRKSQQKSLADSLKPACEQIIARINQEKRLFRPSVREVVRSRQQQAHH